MQQPPPPQLSTTGPRDRSFKGDHRSPPGIPPSTHTYHNMRHEGAANYVAEDTGLAKVNQQECLNRMLDMFSKTAAPRPSAPPPLPFFLQGRMQPFKFPDTPKSELRPVEVRPESETPPFGDPEAQVLRFSETEARPVDVETVRMRRRRRAAAEKAAQVRESTHVSVRVHGVRTDQAENNASAMVGTGRAQTLAGAVGAQVLEAPVKVLIPEVPLHAERERHALPRSLDLAAYFNQRYAYMLRPIVEAAPGHVATTDRMLVLREKQSPARPQVESPQVVCAHPSWLDARDRHSEALEGVPPSVASADSTEGNIFSAKTPMEWTAPIVREDFVLEDGGVVQWFGVTSVDEAGSPQTWIKTTRGSAAHQFVERHIGHFVGDPALLAELVAVATQRRIEARATERVEDVRVDPLDGTAPLGGGG